MAKHGATALSIGLGAAILYLGAHAVTGRQGLVAYVDLQAQQRTLESRLDAVEAERAELEARAARLRAETLDLDYLDERARVTLAAGDSEEIVFALD
ncbi:MAG: septum formation initiator family protein [Hyphomonadaceae bacterium]|jgi:cell division protein FtsB|nr:septum formation initiator family protein [Hyphomonadaceae bacterium]